MLFWNSSKLINEAENLLAKVKSMHLGWVSKLLNFFTVSSPPQITLASANLDNCKEISSEFSYLMRVIQLIMLLNFFF